MEAFRSGRLAPLAPALQRIGRSDPFLMAAAIAYNAFFAMVPLAIAMITALSFVGRSGTALQRFIDAVGGVLPEGVAEFVVDVVVDTADALDGAQGVVIVVAGAVALYSGSRAAYATIKALRLIQGDEDHRGWLVVRGLGIAFTLGAGIALVVGQIFVLVGGDVLRTLEEWTGIDALAEVGSALGYPVLALWTAAILVAIYRWGPPRPAPHPIVSGLVAAAAVGAGSWLFGLIIPKLGLTTLGVLGTVGLVLLWIYTMAFIVIVLPELVSVAYAAAKIGGAHR